jgi:hypothetical protein
MNTGLQDSYNLAWKLALVVKGKADAALLDSYEAERIKVARRLLETTDRGFQVVVSDSWLAGLLRTKILARVAAFAMSRERVQRLAFNTVSQTGIRYRDSTLSKTLDGLPADAPQAGDRFPWLHLRLHPGGAIDDSLQALDDTHFNLIVVGQPAPAADALKLGDLLRIHAIPDDPDNAAELARVKIPTPSFYLLRPDGHVGLCGSNLDTDAVNRYVAEVLRIGA